ncbi:MAG: aminotransferase class I/II-fold pyridoxal phosphate-dependent enzyme [Thermanaerothrix sp.]|nr:aminotransferase class I/II-fold pyridoxal phosphate-dependent enzyme [Thermanaerothrix sp.]
MSSTSSTLPTASTRTTYISQRVASLKPSGIRRFFDIAATMKDVISLGIGEPDFDTPPSVIEAGIQALRNGQTHYTSNAGILELRQALAAHLERLYGCELRSPNRNHHHRRWFRSPLPSRDGLARPRR